MAEPNTMDNRTLLRRTMIMVGAMAGGCVVLVGTLTMIASAIVGHAVGDNEDSDAGGPAALPPASPLHSAPVGARPGAEKTPTPRK